MIHNYYLLEIATPLTKDTLDNDGKITKRGTRSICKDALLALGNLRNVAHLKTHLRFSLDGQKVIVECETKASITKSQFVSKLNELLPWSETQINNNLTITKFTGTYKQSNQKAKQYLIKNKKDW